MIQRNSTLQSPQNENELDMHTMDSSITASSSTTTSSSSTSASGLASSTSSLASNLLNNESSKLRQLNSFLKEELNQIRNATYKTPVDVDASYHNMNEVRSEKSLEAKSVVIERQGGLANKFVLLLLVMWYFFSALTLYTNKYIVTSRKVDPTIMGTIQMIITCLCGFFQLKSQWNKKNDMISPSFSFKKSEYISILFWRNMIIIGFLRLFSIVLGLMALKQATISFVETVKSSSPLFTVIISRLLIGEITGFWTNVSLLPIMIGLALCSSFELNFSAFGFLAAILTNFTECLQNVFSKFLLCSEGYKFTPLEVQFFTSFGSVIALVPICYFTVEFDSLNVQFFSVFLYILNGISFNCQSLLAFTLMSYISPVTYSVCNTLKRALLIWLSVILFQNQVGYMSAIGTFLVIFGVLFYNQSKNLDKQIKNAVTHKI